MLYFFPFDVVICVLCCSSFEWFCFVLCASPLVAKLTFFPYCMHCVTSVEFLSVMCGRLRDVLFLITELVSFICSVVLDISLSWLYKLCCNSFHSFPHDPMFVAFLPWLNDIGCCCFSTVECVFVYSVTIQHSWLCSALFLVIYQHVVFLALYMLLIGCILNL